MPLSRAIKLAALAAASLTLMPLALYAGEEPAVQGSCTLPTPPPGAAAAVTTNKADIAAAPAPVAQAAQEIAMAEPASAASLAAPKPRPSAPKAWWPGHHDGKLNIVAVKGGEFSPSIVVQTDGTFQDTGAAASGIQVKDAAGKAVDSRWTVAANKKTLLLAVKPGRYTVSIGAQLADASGRSVPKASSGTVVVE